MGQCVFVSVCVCCGGGVMVWLVGSVVGSMIGWLAVWCGWSVM